MVQVGSHSEILGNQTMSIIPMVACPLWCAPCMRGSVQQLNIVSSLVFNSCALLLSLQAPVILLGHHSLRSPAGVTMTAELKTQRGHLAKLTYSSVPISRQHGLYVF